MSDRKIYGKVTYDSDIEYEWMTEPEACEKCRALDGKRFQHSDEIPDRPHPNCKCWIKVHQTYKDPLKNLRETRIKARHEREKLEGDIQVLLDECKKYLKIMSSELDQSAYNVLVEVLYNIEHEESLSMQQKLLTELKKELLIPVAHVAGIGFSELENLPEAYNLLLVAIDKKWENNKYIKQNGHSYNSLKELNNKSLETRILNRIHKEENTEHVTDTRVLVLNNDSKIAKKIQTSKEVIAFWHQYKKDLLNGKTITDVRIEFNEDGDLYNAFHGMTIHRAYINNNEDLVIILDDYYNYNAKRTSVRGMFGYVLEHANKLFPYYVMISVIINKEVLKQF